MSEPSLAGVLDWVEKCVANPNAALTAVKGVVEMDPQAEKQYFVHASRFLAFGRLALDRAEKRADYGSDETLALCVDALTEYLLAREAEDAAYVEDTVQRETIVVKPAGIFRKARTEVRETKLHKMRNVMDWPPFENHLDGVSALLETARPKRVQQLLGKTKLLYLLVADRLSHVNAIKRQMDENDSIKADVRALCGVFIEAPFEIGSAIVLSYMGTGTICCKLFEELEPFGPGDTQNPGSILIAMKGGGDAPWTISPVKPISSAA